MTAVIIEDEALVARELRDKIAAVAPDVRILEILPSLRTARKWFLSNAEPDLLFMDVQLSDGVSFELFDTLTLQCPVIFTTAYDEYAIRAFKVNGIDYLLKPVSEEDLARAIGKCQRLVAGGQGIGGMGGTGTSTMAELLQALQQVQQGTPLYKEKFIARVRNNWIPIATAQIAVFIRDNLNYAYTFSGEKYILDYATLEEIEELLDPRLFYRANRQCILHSQAIRSVRPYENQKLAVLLKDPLKMEVDISREKAPGFKRWLER